MKRLQYYEYAFILFMVGCPSIIFAKGGGENHELGFNYWYATGKSPDDSFAFHELQTFFLIPWRAIWVGGEFTYGSNHNPSYSTSVLEIGGLAKYWFVKPGGPVGLNFYTGISLGKEDNGTESNTILSFKTGPELAWFVGDNASVSTRLQYESRRAGANYTVVAVHSGLSLFF